MYTSYFGLAEKPFAITPNPKYLFMSEPHKEALAHLLYGIDGEGCITLLTGDIGTGKTTVCRCLLEQLPENCEIAIILNPRQSILDILGAICQEFKIKVAQNKKFSSTALVDAINDHLLANHARGINTALIIDEAQSLEADVIEQLRLLTNLETETKKLLQIILIGQPELRETFSRPGLEQINQRITARYHLGPLKPKDIADYIDYRLFIAGAPRQAQLFEPAAIAHVSRLSRGVPRLINILCDRAMLGAYVEKRPRISLAIQKRAAKELGYSSNRHLFFLSPWRGLFFILILFGLAALYWQYGPKGQGQRAVQKEAAPATEIARQMDGKREKTAAPETIQIRPLVEKEDSGQHHDHQPAPAARE